MDDGSIARNGRLARLALPTEFDSFRGDSLVVVIFISFYSSFVVISFHTHKKKEARGRYTSERKGDAGERATWSPIAYGRMKSTGIESNKRSGRKKIRRRSKGDDNVRKSLYAQLAWTFNITKVCLLWQWTPGWQWWVI